MPIFDLKCPKCGKDLKDRLLPNAAAANTQICPDCGTTMERQHSVGNLKFLFNYLEPTN